MKNAAVLLFLVTLWCGCSTKSHTDLRKSQIIGTWANVSLLVTMKNINKKDSILEAKEGEWEQVLKMKPILTTFKSDGSFISEYTDLNESLIKSDSGIWFVRHDSLILEVKGKESVYHFTIINDRIRFKANLDWDGDGEVDDTYDAVQIRIKE